MAEQAASAAAESAATAAAAERQALLARQERLDSEQAALQGTLERDQAALQQKTSKASELQEQLQEAFERIDLQVCVIYVGRYEGAAHVASGPKDSHWA